MLGENLVIEVRARKRVAFRVGWIHVHVSGVCVCARILKLKPLLQHRHRHSIITDTVNRRQEWWLRTCYNFLGWWCMLVTDTAAPIATAPIHTNLHNPLPSCIQVEFSWLALTSVAVRQPVATWSHSFTYSFMGDKNSRGKSESSFITGGVTIIIGAYKTTAIRWWCYDHIITKLVGALCVYIHIYYISIS